MKKKRVLIITLAFGVCFSSVKIAKAQMSYAPPMSLTDTIQIEEVLVTGTPVKVNKDNVPMSVSVVNQKEIEESNESSLLPILNGRVPGLFVTERGVTGFGVAGDPDTFKIDQIAF